jgi:hypothetical protein
VAGWRHPAELEPPLRPDDHRDFRRLNGLLQQPHAALGPRGFERPVWHCAVRAAPEDKMLSDDEWAQIAGDIMHRTGLAPYGQEDDSVRWVAVRHGDDHIHLAAMLARQDGGKPRLSNERYRVREACRAAEERYGLRRTAPGTGRPPAAPPAQKTRRPSATTGRNHPRVTLKRAVSTAAAGASSEPEFFARLERAGVLVRKRFSTRNPGEVTGYAVALAGDTTRAGSPVWFGGGKLAPDLTLPKLRCRWQPAHAAPCERLTPAERNAIWEHAARTAADAADQIRDFAATDLAGAADAAWAAADTLHVAASVSGDPALAQVTLVTRLAALAEAIADLREAQRHAAQGAAARKAAERLYAERGARITRPPRQRGTARTVGHLVDQEFPFPIGAVLAEAAAPPGACGPTPANPRPSRGPGSPRPRGPTR